MLTLDRIVKEVAQRVGDRNYERLSEIRSYVQDTVTELTMLLRKGSVLLSTTLSVSNSIATMPDGACAILNIYDTGSIFYEVVDVKEFRGREQRESSLPTAMVFEDVPNWRIQMLNYTDSSASLNVDYLTVSGNPALMPDYYRSLILAGAVANYHNNRSEAQTAAFHWQRYESLKNQFKETQQYNDSRVGRMKAEVELDLLDPNNSYALHEPNTYYRIGGGY